MTFLSFVRFKRCGCILLGRNEQRKFSSFCISHGMFYFNKSSRLGNHFRFLLLYFNAAMLMETMIATSSSHGPF